MSDMTACLNDVSYIPPNNEQNEPSQGDISEISNEPTQAKRNKFEQLYASANEDLYPDCMKESYLMLMLLIPGPTSPGKDINVYLRPLINDLKDLWALKGVDTIDIATEALEGGPVPPEDDHDVIHFDNSSDLALSTSLNDLDFATLNIDGQSIDVDAPLDIIVVDKDDDLWNRQQEQGE
ncbi:reverse transcriptase domain-containing protein [Tanacetum coccineum]|uniref:Reverse transcriptase domain-containing protein n=1 Tax=Tanacetum coccineum TaxID=301880 RepID=A0ABQ4ZMX9_9ASTR